MTLERACVAASILTMASVTHVAQAQSSDTRAAVDPVAAYWNAPLPAPRGAFELSLRPTFVAGVGHLAGTVREDVALNAGTNSELDVGFRVSPAWAVELEAAYDVYAKAPDSAGASSARGSVVRASTTHHFAPNTRTDPWLRWGLGYRWLEETGATGRVHEFHGFELLAWSAGLDLRLARRFAFGPDVGSGVALLLWDGSHAAPDPRPSIFWNLGMQARFDFGGS